MDIIIFDQETTGLLKPELSDIKLQPCVTEICCVKIDSDFNFKGEINTLVKPMFPIPAELEQKIGITNAMVANAPTIVDIYDELYEFWLGCKAAVAHNCAFDVGVLRYDLTRHGLEFKFPWPKHHICTVEASRHIYNRRMKLAELHRLATGKDFESAHRAKADTYALIRSFEWLVKEKHLELPK